MEKIHTKIKDGHALNLRVMLQGTPCEKEITDKDEEYLVWRVDDLVDYVATECGLIQDSDRDVTRERLKAAMEKAAPRYRKNALSKRLGRYTQVTVRTFMAIVLKGATNDCIKYFRAGCRDTYQLVSYSETSPEENEWGDGMEDRYADVNAEDVVETVARRLDPLSAYRRAFASPATTLLMAALIRTRGVREPIRALLHWTDPEFRSNLGLLDEIFNDSRYKRFQEKNTEPSRKNPTYEWAGQPLPDTKMKKSKNHNGSHGTNRRDNRLSAEAQAMRFVDILINSGISLSLANVSQILRDNGLNVDDNAFEQELKELGILKPSGQPTEMAQITEIAKTITSPNGEASVELTGRGLFFVVCLALIVRKEEEQ